MVGEQKKMREGPPRVEWVRIFHLTVGRVPKNATVVIVDCLLLEYFTVFNARHERYGTRWKLETKMGCTYTNI